MFWVDAGLPRMLHKKSKVDSSEELVLPEHTLPVLRLLVDTFLVPLDCCCAAGELLHGVFGWSSTFKPTRPSTLYLRVLVSPLTCVCLSVNAMPPCVMSLVPACRSSTRMCSRYWRS